MEAVRGNGTSLSAVMPAHSASKTRVNALILTASRTPLICRGTGAAARTTGQALGERIDQSPAHGCDRVRDVTFRPQGWLLWVDNRRVAQAPWAARRNEVLRGESSPARRSGIRRLRCTASRGDESQAIDAPRSARAQLPA